jgi:hypothetical protein
VADAAGEIIAGDVEDTPVLEDAAHDDMNVRMPSIEVVDSHPIERGAEIDLCHDIPCERLQVVVGRAVFRRKDGPELIAILKPAFAAGLAVRGVGEGRIESPRLAAATEPSRSR